MSKTTEVLILLGSSSDLPVTEAGTKVLEELGISYSLRICSAHRTPDLLHEIVKSFEEQGGKVFLCVAGMSAHLAGVVASLTVKPVLAIPVYRAETAGLDSLLSMSQMPKGIPVATMGFGKHGFENAALTAAQILALGNPALQTKLLDHRAKQAAKVKQDDDQHRRDFGG